MKKIVIFLASAFMIFGTSLNANNIIIENAEDGIITGWSVYDNNPTGATISNVVDAEQGKVIALNGTGLKNGYMLGHWGSNGFNLINKKLSWKMKYDEIFSVYIIVKTEDGNRYLWYTAEDTDRGVVLGGRYIHHGLGADAIDGTWHTFTRDLEADLQDYASSLHVLKVNAFLVRGSGYIDDIMSVEDVAKACNMDTAITRGELIAKIKNNEDVTNVNTCAITNMSGLFANMDFNQDISGWDVSNVTNMSSMFMSNSTFDQNLSSWDVSKVTDMSDMFHYASLSTENYDALLKGWSKLDLQSNVYFSGLNLSTYSSAGKIARDKLINDYGWTIKDLGLAVNPIFEECNTNVDSTVLKTVLPLHDDFLAEGTPTIEKLPLTQGDTFFFKLGGFGEMDSRLYRVNCKDHSNVDELFYETYGNHINYVGSIGDVAYFNNHHDGDSYGIPFSISEGELLHRISFIESFLSENGLYLSYGGLYIANGNLEVSTSDGKTYIFSPDGTFLGSL